jgi:hypothetical protein
MKEIINYIFCFIIIIPAIIMILSDSILWILMGTIYACCLYVSYIIFPKIWEVFIKNKIK